MSGNFCGMNSSGVLQGKYGPQLLIAILIIGIGITQKKR